MVKTPLAEIVKQEEKRIKKKVGKTAKTHELIEEMGQDSETKAAKIVIEEGKKDFKIENEKSAIIEDILTHPAHKGQIHTYRDLILQEGKRRLKEYDVPGGYYIDCSLSSKGMLFGWRPVVSGQWFMKGLKLSYVPKVDIFAISMMINWALDEISILEERKNVSKPK